MKDGRRFGDLSPDEKRALARKTLGLGRFVDRPISFNEDGTFAFVSAEEAAAKPPVPADSPALAVFADFMEQTHAWMTTPEEFMREVQARKDALDNWPVEPGP